MPRVLVTRHSGEQVEIEAPAGRSLMEAMRANGIDELLALCGGCCTCSTCHVWVDEAFLQRLPPVTDMEKDLLEVTEHRRASSRLSCQIPLTPELDGIRVTVPPPE